MLHYSFIITLPLLARAFPSASQKVSSKKALGLSSDTSLSDSAVSGKATFYDEWESAAVSCNPDKCPKDGWCAAIPAKYMASKAGGANGQTTKESCGKCIKVVHGSKAVVVRVMDTCPGCGDTNVDLSVPAFEKLVGKKEQGRVSVKWAFVDCSASEAGETGEANGGAKTGRTNGETKGETKGEANGETESTKTAAGNATEPSSTDDTSSAVSIDVSANKTERVTDTGGNEEVETKKDEVSVAASEQKESDMKPETEATAAAAAATTEAAGVSGRVEEVDRSTGSVPASKDSGAAVVAADKKVDSKTTKTATTSSTTKKDLKKQKQENRKAAKKHKKQNKQKCADGKPGCKKQKKDRKKKKEANKGSEKKQSKQKTVKKEERVEASG